MVGKIINKIGYCNLSIPVINTGKIHNKREKGLDRGRIPIVKNRTNSG